MEGKNISMTTLVTFADLPAPQSSDLCRLISGMIWQLPLLVVLYYSYKVNVSHN